MRKDHSSTRRRVLLALAALPAARIAGAAEDIEAKRTGGPYVPTPQVVVDEMLRIGKVGPDDFVVDLGSGDGVIVLTAATKLRRAASEWTSIPSWSSSPTAKQRSAAWQIAPRFTCRTCSRPTSARRRW